MIETIEALQKKLKELEARKRAEMEAAIERGDLADPISAIIAGISIKTLLISAAVSAAISAGTFLVSRALTPKPPRQSLGQLSGELQLMNSAPGVFIPEIYGGSPLPKARA